MISPSNSSRGTPVVLWSCVARNETILVEAGGDSSDGSVSITAKELLNRDVTPGWEFHTQTRKSHILNSSEKSQGSKRGSSSSNILRWPSNSNKSPRLKGAKFHVYEKDVNGEYIVWVFACVYNPNNIQKNIVQTFLTKLIADTDHEREQDLAWIYGPKLACQESFGPYLRHYMMQVSHLAAYTDLENHVENAKDRMSKNIELILEREPKLQDLHDEATKLQEMAIVFKRNSEKVQRMKMWHNAKHGLVMGTAITAGVALVAVPPIIALL